LVGEQHAVLEERVRRIPRLRHPRVFLGRSESAHGTASTLARPTSGPASNDQDPKRGWRTAGQVRCPEPPCASSGCWPGLLFAAKPDTCNSAWRGLNGRSLRRQVQYLDPQPTWHSGIWLPQSRHPTFRCMNSRGDIIRWVLPSRQGVFSFSGQRHWLVRVRWPAPGV
jgi:hypothetical protein